MGPFAKHRHNVIKLLFFRGRVEHVLHVLNYVITYTFLAHVCAYYCWPVSELYYKVTSFQVTLSQFFNNPEIKGYRCTGYTETNFPGRSGT